MDESALPENWNDYKNPTVTIKGTTFKIRKLPTMKAVRVLEIIRQGLSGQLDQLQNQESLGIVALKVILGAPTEVFENVRNRLFEEVVFSAPPNVKSFIPLAGMEETAFEDLSPFDVYKLLVRCLAVNFLDSMNEISSSFQLDPQDLNLSTLSTSIPGSQQPKEQTESVGQN